MARVEGLLIGDSVEIKHATVLETKSPHGQWLEQGGENRGEGGTHDHISRENKPEGKARKHSYVSIHPSSV